MVLSASTIDTLSTTSLSIRAAQSSASFTHATVLSRVIAASLAEVSAASTATTRVASPTRVTSACIVGTSMLPWDRCCKNKIRRK
jgi:hypothetical protein